MNAKTWIDTIAAAGYAALFVITMSLTRFVAERATDGFGHGPRDSTDVMLVGMGYFAPAMLFFGVAAYAQRHRWRAREVLHGMAWGWALMPLAVFAGLLVLTLLFG